MNNQTLGKSPSAKISKGLIIDSPWIGHILSGLKTWEMRSARTLHRGWFGLIQKGTGKVCGIARLTDCGVPLTIDELLATKHHHMIPDALILSGAVSKWNTPWKLANIRRLASPLPYTHKPGAVTWVLLDETVTQAIRNEFLDFNEEDGEPLQVHIRPASKKNREIKSTPTSSPAFLVARPILLKLTGTLVGETVLTDGNLSHNHIYLRSFIHKFPDDVIGGSNKLKKAAREVDIDWGGPELERSDIDGAKLFFRSRAWVKRFFDLNAARAGDRVQISMLGPYSYRITLTK